jgi:hypothetical protein
MRKLKKDVVRFLHSNLNAFATRAFNNGASIIRLPAVQPNGQRFNSTVRPRGCSPKKIDVFPAVWRVVGWGYDKKINIAPAMKIIAGTGTVHYSETDWNAEASQFFQVFFYGNLS